MLVAVVTNSMYAPLLGLIVGEFCIDYDVIASLFTCTCVYVC